MAATTIELQLLAETQKATKAIKDFSETSTRHLEKIQSGFSFLKGAAVAAVGFIGVGKMVDYLKDAAKASAEAEAQLNQLNTALQISGNYTEEASKNLQNFAQEIQNTTAFEGDAVIGSMAYLESLTQLSDDGLMNAQRAAIDMAAALGIDLQTATQMVAKGANENTAAFQKMGIQIEKGATEAETLTNVIDALNTKFGGAAAAQLNTYAGQLKRLENNYGDMKESIGSVITQNPAFVGAMSAANTVIVKVIKAIDENKEEVQAVLNSVFKAILNLIPPMIKGFALLFDALNGIQKVITYILKTFIKLVDVMLSMEVVADIVNSISDAFLEMVSVVAGATADLVKFLSKLPGAEKALSVFGVAVEDVEDLAEGIKNVGRASDQAIGSDFAESAREGLRAANESIIEYSESTDKFLGRLSRGANELSNIASSAINQIKFTGKVATQELQIAESKVKDAPSFIANLQEAWKKLGDTISGISSGGFECIDFSGMFDGAIKKIEGAFTNIDQKLGELEIGKTLGEGFNSVLKGKEGALEVVKKGAALIADSFLPGIGGVVSEAVGLLAQGPEKVKEMVISFFQELPNIIVNVVEGLVAAADTIVVALVDSLIINGGIIRISEALAMAMPRVSYALANSFVEALKNLVAKIGQQIGDNAAGAIDRWIKGVFKWPAIQMPSWLSGLKIQTPTWLSSLKISTPPWLQQFSEAITRLTKWSPGDILGGGGKGGIGGSIGSAISSVGKALGLAEGGIVPDGYPNDTYPASLTSGEIVIPRSTSGNLFQLIDSLASGETTTSQRSETMPPIYVNLTIGEKQLADVILNLNRQGYRMA